MSRSVIAAAAVAGLTLLCIAPAVGNGENEFAGFFAKHDPLHRISNGEKFPYKIRVRRAFWNADRRELLVDAETPREKGDLLILEGLPQSDWVTAFRVSAEFGATFALSIPVGQPVPCEVIVRSGTASKVARVINSPSTCNSEVEGMLLASIAPN